MDGWWTRLNLVRDIADLFKDDNTHWFRVKIEPGELRVCIVDVKDLEDKYNETLSIPIYYDLWGHVLCIDWDEMQTFYHADDYGPDLGDLRLVLKVMEYIELHKDEIDKLLLSMESERNGSE